jgi:hypothetical protein
MLIFYNSNTTCTTTYNTYKKSIRNSRPMPSKIAAENAKISSNRKWKKRIENWERQWSSSIKKDG